MATRISGVCLKSLFSNLRTDKLGDIYPGKVLGVTGNSGDKEGVARQEVQK
jgi:hypothetical protein